MQSRCLTLSADIRFSQGRSLTGSDMLNNVAVFHLGEIMTFHNDGQVTTPGCSQWHDHESGFYSSSEYRLAQDVCLGRHKDAWYFCNGFRDHREWTMNPKIYSLGRIEAAVAQGMTIFVMGVRPRVAFDDWWLKHVPLENAFFVSRDLGIVYSRQEMKLLVVNWKQLLERLGVPWTGRDDYGSYEEFRPVLDAIFQVYGFKTGQQVFSRNDKRPRLGMREHLYR